MRMSHASGRCGRVSERSLDAAQSIIGDYEESGSRDRLWEVSTPWNAGRVGSMLVWGCETDLLEGRVSRPFKNRIARPQCRP
jgi:hypothetical protein